jgi:hypothetical protein
MIKSCAFGNNNWNKVTENPRGGNLIEPCALVHTALNLFMDLPAEGVSFPYRSGVRAEDRAMEIAAKQDEIRSLRQL